MPTRMVEEMSAEELEKYKEWLEKQKPMPTCLSQKADGIYRTCGRCGEELGAYARYSVDSYLKYNFSMPKYCHACGQRIKRWAGDE